MSRRNSKRLPPKPGWAMYLRTSSEEAQNPENSQRRQRHAIQRSLFERTDLPVFNEYIDNLSGRYADNRPGYQKMLEEARAGCFSHVAVENAERFGRNDAEALMAIDALHEQGIAVRFADYPDLDPIDPDDRILVSLSFTLARRESIKLGQRVTGGLHAKLRTGGFVGKAPDGYLNCEEKTEQIDKTRAGRYNRWIEPDPEQFKVWRTAWDLLLTDQYTLAEICEELHARGYRFRSGRPFVTVSARGKRKEAANGLSRILNNWFYAGWVVSEKASIPAKTVKGQWKPLVTTEEFEQGLAILAGRQKHRASGGRVHDYLLRGLVYVELEDDRVLRLTGSTPNAGRSGGGTSYYCIESSGVNILCRTVDEQIAHELMKIQVDPDLIPLIRNSYNEEIGDKLGRMRPDQRADIERKLKDVDEEEARALRLYTIGKITDRVWENLWTEWQDRRRTLRHALESLQAHNDVHIANLDAALTIIAKVGILYNKLERSSQKKLLHEMVDRVVVCPEGTIQRMELLPPFAYLKEVTDRVRKGSGDFEGKTKTSAKAGQRSSLLSLSEGKDRNSYVDLVCLKPHLNGLFDLIIYDVVSELLKSRETPDRVCLLVLNRWRELLARDSVPLLDRNAVVGLFGELIVLRDLARINPLAVKAWTGPDKGRFDFFGSGNALEVKTSFQRQGIVLSIHGHDQLDPPSSGNLHLVVIQIEETPADGESLNDIVNSLVSMGVNQVDVYGKLARLGIFPETLMLIDDQRFGIIEQRVYLIDSEFPRITGASFISGTLPRGVISVSYQIDLSVPPPYPIQKENVTEVFRVIVDSIS